MLADMGCTYCIVGHSERRAHFGEDNVFVKQKSAQLLKQNIKPIICVGETLEEREQGKAVDVVQSQITESLPDGAHAENTVIAYEPVWAIGTGKAASLCDITKMHSAIRDHLKSLLADGAEMRILYGGSVKPDNAQDILNSENVGGALIGGASLKADDFAAIGMAVKN
jgi:triosephosphate isomerase